MVKTQMTLKLVITLLLGLLLLIAAPLVAQEGEGEHAEPAAVEGEAAAPAEQPLPELVIVEVDPVEGEAAPGVTTLILLFGLGAVLMVGMITMTRSSYYRRRDEGQPQGS